LLCSCLCARSNNLSPSFTPKAVVAGSLARTLHLFYLTAGALDQNALPLTYHSLPQSSNWLCCPDSYLSHLHSRHFHRIAYKTHQAMLVERGTYPASTFNSTCVIPYLMFKIALQSHIAYFGQFHSIQPRLTRIDVSGFSVSHWTRC
jgi:hypothetical protein